MDDTVVHSGRRTIAIQIQRDGRVVVRAPYAATAEDIRRVVDSHRDWVEKTVRRQQEQLAASPPEPTAQEMQELARQGHPAARRIFRDVGVCLAHTLALYAEIYPLRHVMVLGRVASGIGGEWMTETCRRVLAEEYPQLPLEVLLPDDRFRRIGQSVAAASLP